MSDPVLYHVVVCASCIFDTVARLSVSVDLLHHAASALLVLPEARLDVTGKVRCLCVIYRGFQCQILQGLGDYRWFTLDFVDTLSTPVSLLHKQLCLEPHSSCCASSLQSPLDVSTRRGSAQSPLPRHLALKPKCKCKETSRTSVSSAMAEMTEYLCTMHCAAPGCKNCIALHCTANWAPSE